MSGIMAEGNILSKIKAWTVEWKLIWVYTFLNLSQPRSFIKLFEVKIKVCVLNCLLLRAMSLFKFPKRVTVWKLFKNCWKLNLMSTRHNYVYKKHVFSNLHPIIKIPNSVFACEYFASLPVLCSNLKQLVLMYLDLISRR